MPQFRADHVAHTHCRQDMPLARAAIGAPDHRAVNIFRGGANAVCDANWEILLDIAENPESEPQHVHRRIGRPRNTVRRELEALYMLRLLRCVETDQERLDGRIRTLFQYSLADDFDRDTLAKMSNFKGKGRRR